jgi:hypothetical protein
LFFLEWTALRDHIASLILRVMKPQHRQLAFLLTVPLLVALAFVGPWIPGGWRRLAMLATSAWIVAAAVWSARAIKATERQRHEP